MATTKEDVADFINGVELTDIWTEQEKAYVQGKLDPFFAQTLIKLVGDVGWLVQVRENTSKKPTNQDGFS